ncbi:hypothetical protein G5B10_05220 [Fluviicola sp. SGL-29]|nr:hypothetical protein [Fluviicola sp. SGL-29]
MKQVLLGFTCCVCLFASAQTSVTEIKTPSGMLTVDKSDNALSISGILHVSAATSAELTKFGLQNQKGKLKCILSKNCQLTGIEVIGQSPVTSLDHELKQFASDLHQRVRQQELDHLFQFDNELGFVNEDSCSDNLNVIIALVLK